MTQKVFKPIFLRDINGVPETLTKAIDEAFRAWDSMECRRFLSEHTKDDVQFHSIIEALNTTRKMLTTLGIWVELGEEA